ncbi:MAG: hypothetical protein WBL66_18205 [Candidatus Acidiferrales bacterium]
MNIVKGDVRRFLSIVKNMLDPTDFLSKFGFAHSRKPNPNPPFIDDEQASTPSQKGSFGIVDLLEVYHLENLTRRGIGYNDCSVDRREVQLALVQMAVMYTDTG